MEPLPEDPVMLSRGLAPDYETNLAAQSIQPILTFQTFV